MRHELSSIYEHDADLDFKSFYLRRLPHIRNESSIYFVTWRTINGQHDLSQQERDLIASCIHHFNGIRYDIAAYVVMNDHVHAILRPRSPFQLHQIVHTWKSYSANQLHYKKLRHNVIWQSEYFDRIIRGQRDLVEKLDYVMMNPKKRWPDCDDYKWSFEDIAKFI